MPWYRVGTVAITAGQTTVTGTGTNFPANSRVGDAFQGPDGRWYEVTNIASATVISILPAYLGATITAGAYGLAPMQGYVKESADRLRQLVDQFGATLAGLGSVSTENVVPVAKGGTGGTTPALARTGLQLGSAAVAAIVGTVSQAGGVPTGAIIERGSNGNGDYVKYADGTMICWQSNRATVEIPIATSFFGGFRSSDITFNFPATFSEAPSVQATTATCFGVLPYQANTGAFVCNFLAVASQASAARNVKWIATGRWF